MHWIMALAGSILGLVAGDGSAAFLGFLAGALLGWQWGRIRALGRRLDAVEARLRALRSSQVARQGAQPVAEAAAPGTASPKAPVATSDAGIPPAHEAGSGSPARHAEVNPAEREAGCVDSTGMESAPELLESVVAPTSPARTEPIRAMPPAAVSNARVQTGVPAGPSPLERGLQRVRAWFFSGNVPVKIGMLVLLFGVAAALKYSIDAGWVSLPLPLRLALIAAGGVAAVLWGWRNRIERPAFGLSLQGGGIGILLLTTFAAYRLYALLPAGVAFSLVLVLVAGAAMLAVLQNAVALAVPGFLGGYLAPVLLSTGSGSHVVLFSYYALLNLAVFAIAWVRHWRALNLIGFAFTFLIGLGWGMRYYRPEHFATVEPFLILFFGFYVAIAALHALRAPGRLRGLVDGPIVFGTPLLAFGLQAGMLHDQPMRLAWSAMAVAVLYAGLAWWLLRRRDMALIGQSFGVLAAGFATLAIPLAFSSRWTAITWALEGAALVWLGLRQRRALPQASGLALQLLAGAACFISLFDGGWDAAAGEWPVLNGHALAVSLLAASAFATSWLHERAGAGRLAVWPGFLVGTAWWHLAGAREIDQHAHGSGLLSSGTGTPLAWLAFAALTLLAMGGLRHLLRWPRLGWNVLLALALSAALALIGQHEAVLALHWPQGTVWLAWVAAALAGLALLRRPAQRGLGVGHLLFLATLALVYGGALAQVARAAALGEDWVFALGLAPLIALALLTWRLPALGAFPLAREFPGYARIWFALSGIVLALAWAQSLLLSGDTAPLPFLPLVNPSELLQAIGLIVAARWAWQRVPEPAPALVAGAALLVLSLAGLRAVHHFAGLAWNPMILNHGVAQTTLTVLWSILGVGAWLLGSRRQRWSLWLAGAITMGLVLLKLVLVDRQYVGNIAGIVSFMAVGLLLVLVGRIAPTPPRHEPRQESRP